MRVGRCRALLTLTRTPPTILCVSTITSHPSVNWNLFGNTNVFRFGKETQRFFTAFAADAALFHAAEWNAQVAHEPAIYPDGAGVDSFGHPMGAAQVLRPNARREAVFNVVGVIDHVFFTVKGRDCYHG